MMRKTKADCIVQLERYFRHHPPAPGQPAVFELPFVCSLCQLERFELELVDGDGRPICKPCIDEIADELRTPS